MAGRGIAWAGGLLALALVVSGCSRTEAPQLMNLRATGSGPDAFSVLPGKPLQMPADLAALPAPEPGAPNLTDPTPRADAVAALGGDPARVPPEATLAGRTPPRADGGLVAHAARFGTEPGIRARLAEEDLDYRRDNNGRLLERAFSVNVYFRAYRPQALDQYAELERWRARGVRTVGAPPKPEAQ